MKKVLLIILSVLFLFSVSSAKTVKLKKIKTLSSTSWKLTNFQNETLIQQYIGSRSLGEITLEFPKKENLISGFSGINTYSGNFEVNGENITFSNLASTKSSGPRNILEQEYKYFNALSEVTTYKIIDEKTLKLYTSNDLELTFTRIK